MAWLYRGSEYTRGFQAGSSYDGLGSTQSATNSVTVNYTGDSQSHYNISPYLAIYLWKRLA